jgi:hypothetical protein
MSVPLLQTERKFLIGLNFDISIYIHIGCETILHGISRLYT